jgi:hypothetical protein
MKNDVTKSKPNYQQDIIEAGINVSALEARKYRQLLLNIEKTETYLRKRLDPVIDWAWAKAVVLDSEGYHSRTKDGADVDTILKEAMHDLAGILSKPKLPKNRLAEKVSAWLFKWSSQKGVVKMRNTINSTVSSERRKRTPINIFDDTRQRLNQHIKHSDSFSSVDDFISHMLDDYEARHGATKP